MFCTNIGIYLKIMGFSNSHTCLVFPYLYIFGRYARNFSSVRSYFWRGTLVLFSPVRSYFWRDRLVLFSRGALVFFCRAPNVISKVATNKIAVQQKYLHLPTG
jgi:hypothetical protein